jgi:hypothetical protein
LVALSLEVDYQRIAAGCVVGYVKNCFLFHFFFTFVFNEARGVPHVVVTDEGEIDGATSDSPEVG